MEDIYKNAQRHNIKRCEAYTYDMLLLDIDNFKARFSSVPVFSIGKSVQGRNIFALKLGNGSKRIFICGAHHGMEWLTAKICMQFAFDIAEGLLTPHRQSLRQPTADTNGGSKPPPYNTKEALGGGSKPPPYGFKGRACGTTDKLKNFYNAAAVGTASRRKKCACDTFLGGIRHGNAEDKEKHCFSSLITQGTAIKSKKIFNCLNLPTIYIVPMVNPDGVELAANGFRWQANVNGVDLNHNYDALWELASQTEKKYGVSAPCASKFGGTYPESEPESRAVADFTRQNNFDLAIALHSQGEVIYYDFCGIVPSKSEEYLNRFEAVSKYRRDIPEGTAICGGYKDWFIKKYKKPAFTIEVGLGENPLPLSQFDDVYEGVLPILQEVIV